MFRESIHKHCRGRMLDARDAAENSVFVLFTQCFLQLAVSGHMVGGVGDCLTGLCWVVSLWPRLGYGKSIGVTTTERISKLVGGSLVFADQETRWWPPCLHGECFGIWVFCAMMSSRGCEELEGGLAL